MSVDTQKMTISLKVPFLAALGGRAKTERREPQAEAVLDGVVGDGVIGRHNRRGNVPQQP